MAAGATNIYLSNGQILSCYHSSSPINSPLNVSMTGPAGSTSPFDFFVQSTCTIVDVIVTTSTAGELEFYREGKATGKKIPVDQRYALANDRKNIIPRYTLVAGVRYQVVPSIATS